MDPRIYSHLRQIEGTHWWFAGRRRIVAAVLGRLGVRPRSVLDVGCGAGTNLELLATLYPASSLVGIDIEREPLEYCRSDRAAPVLQGDVQHLPFAAAAFDLITALDTLEHVEDDVAVLQELFRTCRPGGTLLLTVPAFPFLWGNVDELGHHHRRYRRRELAERVTRAGFSVQLLRFMNYLLFPPIAAVRVASRMGARRRAAPTDDVRSDFDLVKSGPLNSLLARLFALEAYVIGVAPPFGVSLLCAAVRDRP
jgi:SAM-dependent methyltransferase